MRPSLLRDVYKGSVQNYKYEYFKGLVYNFMAQISRKGLSYVSYVFNMYLLYYSQKQLPELSRNVCFCALQKSKIH